MAPNTYRISKIERSVLEEKTWKLSVKELVDIREGMVYVSDRPGLGIEMDEKHFHCILLIDRDWGRSFTLGVADGITVLANQATMANAAVTFLGNKTHEDNIVN